MHNIFKWIFVYYKCYTSIELAILKKVMLIKQANQKSGIFVTIGSSYTKVLISTKRLQQMSWFVNDVYEP